MSKFECDLEQHNSYDREENENAEEQIAGEENIRDFDLADETHSFYASDS